MIKEIFWAIGTKLFYPGIFSPIIEKNKVISDGGVGMPVPITVIKNEWILQ